MAPHLEAGIAQLAHTAAPPTGGQDRRTTSDRAAAKLSNGLWRRSYGALTLAAAVACAGAALDTASSFAAPQSGGQRPVFGATVSRVQVDAIVTDRDGRFVDDLTAADFTVFEDGAPQTILDVQLVDLAAGAVSNLGAGGDTAATPMERPATTEPPAPDVDAASDYAALVFLIDGPSLDLKTRSRFVSAWQELLESTATLRMPRAVYMVDSYGTLEELVALTLETEPLLDAVEAVRSTVTPGNSMKRNFYELLNDMTMPEGIDAARAPARGLEQEERARSLSSLELLKRFCDALAARPGRTALVWVTTGVKITVGGPYTVLTGEDPAAPAAIWERQQQLFDPYAPDPQITEAQRRLHEAANSANVSIYSVDPTLRADLRSMDNDVAARSSSDRERLASMEFQSSLDSLRDSLKDAADATGGEAFVYWTDLGAALADIERDSSRFYLLTYAAPPPDGDGAYHEIRVEIVRPDVTVRGRGGYVDLAANERRSRDLIGALSLPGAVAGPPVRARTFRRWSADGEPIVQLAVGFDPAGGTDGRPERPGGASGESEPPEGSGVELAAVEHAGPGNLVFHAVAAAADGRIVDEVHQGVRSLFVPVDAAAAAAVWPHRYVHDWALPPGRYALRIVMEDEISGALGATRIDVEVDDPNEPGATWRTSDLVLAMTDGSGPPLPLLVDEAAAHAQLIVYVEVAGGDAPVMSGDVFSADGAARLAPLPPVSLQEEAGIHRGALRIQGMPPGEIVVQIAVTDAVPARHKVFRRTLKVSAVPER